MISGTQELSHSNYWPQDIEQKRFMKWNTLHSLFHYIFHQYDQQETNNKYILWTSTFNEYHFDYAFPFIFWYLLVYNGVNESANSQSGPYMCWSDRIVHVKPAHPTIKKIKNKYSCILSKMHFYINCWLQITTQSDRMCHWFFISVV